MKALDYIFALIFIVLIAFSFSSFSGGEDEVLIEADGKEYRYPLSEERTVSVLGPLGQTVIEIKDGDVRIIDSPCPNKTCLDTRMGNTICCLPNRVLVTLEASDSEVDAYAY